MSDDPKLEWNEAKTAGMVRLEAEIGYGLKAHVWADNSLYLCRPEGPFDNVDLGAFQKPFAKAQEIANLLRAEPPTDGDRQISLKAAIEVIEKYAEESSDLNDPRGAGHSPDYWNGLDEAISLLETLGAAEPPSAPAPTNCKHGKWGKAWVPPDDDPGAPYSRRIEVFKPYKKPFCPDCGARLGTPEGQTE